MYNRKHDTGQEMAPGRPRICLAASGGGHMQEIFDLEPVWGRYPHFIVTEESALARGVATQHATHFLPHIAWGQARQGALWKLMISATRGVVRAAAIMLRERPDIILTTGAGAVYPCVVWGRLLGAKIIVIESFARFDRPSLFFRLSAPLSRDLVVQAEKLKQYYPRASVFDPLVLLSERDIPPKEDLIFVTVGATLPFNRLIKAVANLAASGAIHEKLMLQIGTSDRAPEVECRESFDYSEIQAVVGRANIVICHAGVGSIITALRAGCHVIVMPRRSDLREHYDDHQFEIADAFEARGLVTVARDEEELREAIARARSAPRIAATTESKALQDHVANLIAGARR